VQVFHPYSAIWGESPAIIGTKLIQDSKGNLDMNQEIKYSAGYSSFGAAASLMEAVRN
jgi:hypothetical protein